MEPVEIPPERVLARLRANRPTKNPENPYYIVDEHGCWIWQRALWTRYGFISWDNRKMRAHRAVYVAHRGPIPKGLQLDHLCRNKGCVNPSHLEPVTNGQNQLRRYVFERDQGISRRVPARDWPHGTNSTYSNQGCRCDDCKRAHRDESRRCLASKAERTP